jgi:hypothetical protein
MNFGGFDSEEYTDTLDKQNNFGSVRNINIGTFNQEEESCEVPEKLSTKELMRRALGKK